MDITGSYTSTPPDRVWNLSMDAGRHRPRAFPLRKPYRWRGQLSRIATIALAAINRQLQGTVQITDKVPHESIASLCKGR
jgi:hypothetical protein